MDSHPYLAMDTEFPGVVARPVGNFKNSGEYHYQTLRCVDEWVGWGVGGGSQPAARSAGRAPGRAGTRVGAAVGCIAPSSPLIYVPPARCPALL